MPWHFPQHWKKQHAHTQTTHAPGWLPDTLAFARARGRKGGGVRAADSGAQNCGILPGDSICVVPYLRNVVCNDEYRRSGPHRVPCVMRRHGAAAVKAKAGRRRLREERWAVGVCGCGQIGRSR